VLTLLVARRLAVALPTLVVVLLAAWPIVAFVGIAASRIGYPFDLEWMESGVIDHVRVVLSGEPLYREPSLEFTPYIYTPGYYYASALVSSVAGVGYLSLRALSVVSILACFACIGAWVYLETRAVLAGLLAAGLFAATYGQSGYWFDLARVDSFCLALALGGTVLARWGRGHGTGIAAGALLAAAVLTKQSAIAFAIPPLLFRYSGGIRAGVASTAAFALVLAGVVLPLELASGGWFSFYVWTVPGDHAVVWGSWAERLREAFAAPMMPMTLSALAVVVGWVRPPSRSAWALLAGLVVLVFSTCLSALLHTGGYSNNLIPIHALFAVCSGLVFARLWRAPSNPYVLASRRGFAVLVLGAQLGLLSWEPRERLVPNADDVAAGQAVLAALRESRAPTWVIASGYPAFVAAGAPVTAPSHALTDIFKSRQEDVKRRLREEVSQAIRERRFATIVLDRAIGFLPIDVGDEIRRHYRLRTRLFAEDDPRLWPRTGARVRPDEFWVAP